VPIGPAKAGEKCRATWARNAIKFVAARAKISELDAYALCGVAVSFRVTRELCQAFLEIDLETLRILPVLESNDCIIGIPHDDHRARRSRADPEGHLRSLSQARDDGGMIAPRS
jgi:hypothetical protein